MQLSLPFEATGLSERIQADGQLKVTPDFDVFSWLCERWQTRPTDSGWMKPTLYEVGSALYGTAPTGEHYRILRESLERLARTRITITGYDVETCTFRDNWIVHESLMAVGRPQDDPSGLQRPSIRLAEWLRQALDEEKVVRVHWRTLRAFNSRQTLAKRLWLYLCAEKWARMTSTTEGTWIAAGDRLFAALGMNHAEHRHARRALKAACLMVRKTDPRYGAGELDLVQMGRSWRIQAERPTWDAWRAQRDEQAAVRAEIAASLHNVREPRAH